MGARQESEAELATWTGEKIGRLDAAIKNMVVAVEKVASPSLPGDASDSLGIKAAMKESRKESRFAEIRRGLEGLDALEVEAVYFGSANEEVRDAIETAPHRIRRSREGGVFAEPWVTSEQVARQRLGRASSKNPEIVAQLRTLQDSRASLAHFAAVLGTNLRKAVPLGPSDPVVFRVDGQDRTVAAKK